MIASIPGRRRMATVMKTPSFTRRHFLKTSAAALAAASLGAPRGLLAAGAPSYGGKTIPFGIQLWTVRGAFTAEPEATLTKLASLGLKGVEFYTAFPGGRDAKTMRALLDRVGLKAIGYHIGGLHTMSDDDLKRHIETNQIIGNPRLGVSFTQVGEGPFDSTAATTTAKRQDWEAIADKFSALAAKLKPHGMATYYHCHRSDFARINGETTWDIFFQRASKDVFMQVDLGHMGTAGVDQVATMKKFPGRAKTVHVKPANGGDGRLVGDPNDGNLTKWPAIFAACEDKNIGGTEWYILEYDNGSMEQVERTVARLKEWGKI
jgi:sugar phosphate isomerase/epimerase